MSVFGHPGQSVRIVIVRFEASPTPQNPKLKCIALAVRSGAVIGSGVSGLGTGVGEGILIVPAVSVMAGLKAFEIFLDQPGKTVGSREILLSI